MSTAPILDPLRFPLGPGRRLIEASAGTGKTYTIAALYLRLILGHGCQRPFLPEEVLVMTFTNAATLELRARIRQRLHEAGEFFARRAESADAFLQALRGEYPEADWPRLAQRLEWAAEGMDQAAIYTIHAWVQRVLQENAFAANSDFALELVADAQTREGELIQDYLRLYLQPLSVAQLRELQTWGGDLVTPEGLAGQLQRYMDHAEDLRAGPPPRELIDTLLAQQRPAVQEFRQQIAAEIDAFAAYLDDLLARKLVDAKKLQKRYWAAWLQKLRDWCADDALAGPELPDSAWHRLSPAGLAEAQKEPGKELGHPFVTLLAALQEWTQVLLEARRLARAELLRHALSWIAERKRQLQERGEFDFSGLLRRLRATLEADGGDALARLLARRYPWALVDEFQDTDPQQYAILDTVYQPENQDAGLLLIGDPKQAIYAFRGADLPTYLQARRDCAGEIYRLACNYRSSTALVAALNAFLSRLDAGAEGGIFGLRQGGDDPMPYLPVTAAGRKEQPYWGDAELPPLEIAYLETEELLPKTRFIPAMAEVCAERIAQLLAAAQEKQAGFLCDGNRRPLRAADIAALVNTVAEADALRAALRRRGVRSVYLSERESVYTSAEAMDLEALLAACLEPNDEPLLQAALAGPLLQLSWAELTAWRQDEALQEQLLSQFQGYGELWRERGVLAMLFRLFQDFSVPAKLLQGPGGGRRLTNLLQITEMLQAASRHLPGEHALLRFLAEQRQERASADETLLRLESDADLLRVVTIHKAKGLQYPLVFLPFLLNSRVTPEDGLWVDRENGVLMPLDAETWEQAERERLQEDARKLYVALTRAEFTLWLGVAAHKDANSSAFGQLLLAGAEPSELYARLATLLADLPGTQLQVLTDAESAQQLSQPSSAVQQVLPRQARVIEENWWIASYTALHHGRRGVSERLAEEDPAAAPGAVAGEFSPGAATGILLHDLLRWMAQFGFSRLAADPAPLAQEIHRRGLGEQQEALLTWLLQILAHPLALPDGDCCRLQDLQEYSAELEFWLPLQQTDSQRLDEILCTYLWPGEARPQLNYRRLGGIFKGFIDLAFCWRGTYYLLDYKSNFLGVDTASYAPAQLQAAILAQRYDLQLGLYLFALRRLLQQRLPTAQVAAALTLFLRGVSVGAAASLSIQPEEKFFFDLEPCFRAEVSQ